jgi:hypothetical protein
MVSSVAFAVSFAGGSGSAVCFSESFEGTQVDSSKWVVLENTDLSGYPSYGGNVSLSNGQLALSSDGSSFPWVYTRNNPFPTSGDFSFQFTLTFTCLGDWGSGIRVFNDSPTKDADKWTGSILIIQAGDEDSTRGKITVELCGKEIHRIYVPGGFKPSADPHVFRLEYIQGNYTMYVDNQVVGTAKSDVRASVIGIGHPPCYYVPFSPQKVQEWGYWGWTAFKIDALKVTAKEIASSNVLFEDQFDGTQIDTSKWLVTENTDRSGYPAWGGKVIVSGGYLALSSNGSTFPWVRTINNPFPAAGDFAVEINLTYKIIGDSGNGIRIYSNQQTANNYDSCNNLFTLWAHDEGETTGVIIIELFNKLVYRDYYPGFKPASPPHMYRFEYSGGNYTVYVDNKAVATGASTVRPTAIGVGHPPINDLPYSPQTTQTWAYWGWSSFNLDSIKVMSTTGGNPQPDQNETEPTNSTQKQSTELALQVSASQQLGLQLDITGNLTSQNNPIPDQNVILSYNIPGTDAWTPITSTTTGNNGDFSAQWLPIATGVFTLKVQYSGSTVYEESQACKNVSVTQNDNRVHLIIESNSTLSAIVFNSETNEASFKVSGPTGTHGYIRCTIPKTLLSDPNLLNVYLDNSTVAYSVTEQSTDSWLLYLTYSHSSHTIMIELQAASQPQLPADFTIYAVIVAGAILALIAAGILVFARKLNK